MLLTGGVEKLFLGMRHKVQATLPFSPGRTFWSFHGKGGVLGACEVSVWRASKPVF